MDFKRIALAAVVTRVADVIYGLVVWMGMLGPEMARHAGVFRSEAAINAYMPLTFAGALLAMFVLVLVYSKGYEGGSGVQEGFRFGLLASTASFIEMLLVGTVIGVAYRPVARPVAAGA